MTKTEFLEKLRAALEQEVDAGTVRENLEYYSQYITEEMQKGKNEAEVTESLGDPWVIARTIIDTSGGPSAPGAGSIYEQADSGQRRQRQESHGSVHVFGIDSWWKKLALVLVIVGILMLVIAVIGGIISFVAPLVLPIVLIVLVIRLLGGRR